MNKVVTGALAVLLMAIMTACPNPGTSNNGAELAYVKVYIIGTDMSTQLTRPINDEHVYDMPPGNYTVIMIEPVPVAVGYDKIVTDHSMEVRLTQDETIIPVLIESYDKVTRKTHYVRIRRYQSTSQETPEPTVTPGPSPEPALYKVGDRGPAGGYIFYVKDRYSDGWRYMEVAGQNHDENLNCNYYSINNKTYYVPGVLWGAISSYSRPYLHIFGAKSKDIGAGLANTIAIVEAYGKLTQEDTIMQLSWLDPKIQITYAAEHCYELVHNGYSDWFLPSADEFEAIIKNVYLKGLGNFIPMNLEIPNSHRYYWDFNNYDEPNEDYYYYYYWTSTQISSSHANIGVMRGNECQIGGAAQGSTGIKVRAARRF
jgi:hypothetical protein